MRSASGDSHPDLGGWVHWSFKCLLIAGIQEEQRWSWATRRQELTFT